MFQDACIVSHVQLLAWQSKGALHRGTMNACNPPDCTSNPIQHSCNLPFPPTLRVRPGLHLWTLHM